MSKNRKLSRREAHLRDVYENQIDPEAYLRMERALKWQPVKAALEVAGLTITAVLMGIAGWAYLAVTH